MITQEEEYNKLEFYLTSNYEDSTVQSYLFAIKRFVKQFPVPHKVTLSEVEHYLLKRKKANDSVEYRTVSLAGIKALFHFYVHIGKLTRSPIKSLFISTKTKKKGVNTNDLLTQEELMSLLTVKEERFKNVTNRNKSMIGLFVFQGLSSGELVGLTIDDIDLELGRVTIKKSAKRNGRTLELKPNQILALDRYITNERPILAKTSSKQLFVSMRGLPIGGDGVQAFISRLMGSYHKKVSPKNIRKSVISLWLNERNIPIEVVQIMAGHKYPSSTEKYYKIDYGDGQEVLTELHDEIFK